MKQLVRATLVGFVLAMVVVHAQANFAGRWQGKTDGGRAVALELKPAGATLAGSITIEKDAVPIADVKVQKNTLSFNAPVRGKPSSMRGQVAGDQMVLTLQGAKNPVTLKRVK